MKPSISLTNRLRIALEDIRNTGKRFLQRLVERGNTVVVIEHNSDVIKVADHIIDIGPEGALAVAKCASAGTPEQLAKKRVGYTAKLRAELHRLNNKK